MASRTDELDEYVEDVARQVNPDRIFTTGADGYDGHPDHIATHFSVLRTAARLQRLGSSVTVWSLDMSERKGLVVAGQIERKTGAMDEHVSQKAVPDLMRWGDTDLYTPVIAGPEIYRQELDTVDLALGSAVLATPSRIY